MDGGPEIGGEEPASVFCTSHNPDFGRDPTQIDSSKGYSFCKYSSAHSRWSEDSGEGKRAYVLRRVDFLKWSCEILAAQRWLALLLHTCPRSYILPTLLLHSGKQKIMLS
jgi:hypothetical protein